MYPEDTAAISELTIVYVAVALAASINVWNSLIQSTGILQLNFWIPSSTTTKQSAIRRFVEITSNDSNPCPRVQTEMLAEDCIS